MKIKFLIYMMSVLIAVGCLDGSETIVDEQSFYSTSYDWQLPKGQALPIVPSDNPMTEAKFQLGRHLFFDERLSGNGTQSCGSCHQQELAFTDGLSVAVGSTGDIHPRNSQALINIAYNSTITWANPSLRDLETQILLPLFGEAPVEQGLSDENLPEVVERLRSEPLYEGLFLAAFPEAESYYTTEQIVFAIASFVRGLISFDSPYDRYLAGDEEAVSEGALRGRDLFFGESLECFHCHGGYNFTDSAMDRTTTFIERPFHNTGLFNVGGTGDFPEGNQGVYEITGNPDDRGKFRAVTLRNIAVTAPYMHDGSISSLESVIDFYSAGGRNIVSGSNRGDGRVSPLKDGFVSGFSISASQKTDLISFLESLTDEAFLTHERFSNPWITE